MAKAQKGDLIRVTYVDTVNGHYVASYKIGDILEVVQYHNVGEIDSENDCVKTTEGHVLYNHEYEIHRKAGEEDSPLDTVHKTVAKANETPKRLVEGIYIRDDEPQDAINSPNHYTQGRFETIEIIEEITQGYSDGYVAYCVGNALKYLARAPFKHGEPTEDIGKAAKYLSFALERLQTQK